MSIFFEGFLFDYLNVYSFFVPNLLRSCKNFNSLRTLSLNFYSGTKSPSLMLLFLVHLSWWMFSIVDSSSVCSSHGCSFYYVIWLHNLGHCCGRKEHWDFLNEKKDIWIEKAFLGYIGSETTIRKICPRFWCKICIQIESKYKLIFPKLNYLWNHVGHYKTLVAMPWVKKGKHYFLKNNIHVANEKLYFAKGPKIMLQQVIHGAI